MVRSTPPSRQANGPERTQDENLDIQNSWQPKPPKDKKEYVSSWLEIRSMKFFRQINKLKKPKNENLDTQNPWQPKPPKDKKDYVLSWLEDSLKCAHISGSKVAILPAKKNEERQFFSENQKNGEANDIADFNEAEAACNFERSRETAPSIVRSEQLPSPSIPNNSCSEFSNFPHTQEQCYKSKLHSSKSAILSEFSETLNNKSIHYLIAEPNVPLFGEKQNSDQWKSFERNFLDSTSALTPKTSERMEITTSTDSNIQTSYSKPKMIDNLDAMAIVDFSSSTAMQALSDEVGNSICRVAVDFHLGKIDLITLQKFYFEQVVFLKDLQARLKRFASLNPQATSVFERSNRILLARMSHIANQAQYPILTNQNADLATKSFGLQTATEWARPAVRQVRGTSQSS